MKAHEHWDKGAYLNLGDLWFCLSCGEVSPAKDYSHLAFDIAEQDFPTFAAKLRQAGVKEWKHNKSEGYSLYLLDPDGHKLALHCGHLQSLLDWIKVQPYSGLKGAKSRQINRLS